jgi:hypothetical protein
MKTVISITEARKRLPRIIKSIKRSPDTVYQISVYNEVVAEIRSPAIIKPGEAAAKLIELRKKITRKKKSYRIPISENIKEHLYVAEGRD